MPVQHVSDHSIPEETMSREHLPGNGWTTDPSGVRTGNDADPQQLGESYSVRYLRADRLGAFIDRTAYVLEVPEQPGTFFVRVMTEWLICDDPADPGGSETWAAPSVTDDEPGSYSSVEEAQQTARRVAAELLADAGSQAWDGCQPLHCGPVFEHACVVIWAESRPPRSRHASRPISPRISLPSMRRRRRFRP